MTSSRKINVVTLAESGSSHIYFIAFHAAGNEEINGQSLMFDVIL